MAYGIKASSCDPLTVLFRATTKKEKGFYISKQIGEIWLFIVDKDGLHVKALFREKETNKQKMIGAFGLRLFPYV